MALNKNFKRKWDFDNTSRIVMSGTLAEDDVVDAAIAAWLVKGGALSRNALLAAVNASSASDSAIAALVDNTGSLTYGAMSNRFAVLATLNNTMSGYVSAAGATRTAVDARAQVVVDAALSTAVAWTSYTPALTNWDLNDGDLTGRYRKIGRVMTYSIRYVIGAADVPSGNLVFSLPAPSVAGPPSGVPRGNVALLDVSTSARKNWFATVVSSSTIQISDADNVHVTPTSPWTWGVGDAVYVWGSYETAT
jgi:hypothetical protein